MKTEHVNAVISFLRRLRPVDLVLPAGAAIVSAGLQQLVDREDRQRRRLAALQELVDVHRGALVDAGVELPAELVDDELHPLDVDGALQIALSRTASDPDYRIAGNANPEIRPRRRAARRLAVLGLAGVAGVTVWARGYARTYGQEPTVLGFLTALRGPGTTPEPKTSSNSYPGGGEVSPVDELPEPHPHSGVRVDAAQLVDACVGSLVAEPCDYCGHDHDPQTTVHPAGPPAAGVWERDGVIGHGEPPLEECGWPNCTWTSEAIKSELSQRTAAAVHRNRCVYRPAGAIVPGA